MIGKRRKGPMRTFKVLAALLVYPEREVIDCLDEMEAILDREALLSSTERKGVRALIEHLRTSDLMDAQALYVSLFDQRSEERRVGKECVGTCRSRWSPHH